MGLNTTTHHPTNINVRLEQSFSFVSLSSSLFFNTSHPKFWEYVLALSAIFFLFLKQTVVGSRSEEPHDGAFKGLGYDSLSFSLLFSCFWGVYVRGKDHFLTE